MYLCLFQTADDQTSLMASAHMDPELGIVSTRTSGSLPPQWYFQISII